MLTEGQLKNITKKELAEQLSSLDAKIEATRTAYELAKTKLEREEKKTDQLRKELETVNDVQTDSGKLKDEIHTLRVKLNAKETDLQFLQKTLDAKERLIEELKIEIRCARESRTLAEDKLTNLTYALSTNKELLAYFLYTLTDEDDGDEILMASPMTLENKVSEAKTAYLNDSEPPVFESTFRFYYALAEKLFTED